MIFELGDRKPVIEGNGHFIAENATLVGDVHLEDRVSVWFGAVIRADNDLIEIGRNSNVQDGAILHTDPGIVLHIGSNVTVGHRAMLHGCRIGDNSLIGIGSIVLNNAVIGNNCIVGANSLVTEGKTFPDGSLIMGSPARVIRALNQDEIDLIQDASMAYVEKSQQYCAQLSAQPDDLA